MRAYEEALLISKATGQNFNAVLTATAKGQDGITTSLRRYGMSQHDRLGYRTTQRDPGPLRWTGLADTDATDVLKAHLANFTADIGSKFVPILDNAINFVMQHWPEIDATMQKVWGNVKPLLVAFGTLVEQTVATIQKHWDTIQVFIEPSVDSIKTAVKVITDALHLVTDLLSGKWSDAWHQATKLVGDLLGGMLTQVKDVLKEVGTVLSGAAHALASAFTDIGKGIGDGFISGINLLIRLLDGVDIKIGKVSGSATRCSVGWIGTRSASRRSRCSPPAVVNSPTLANW